MDRACSKPISLPIFFLWAFAPYKWSLNQGVWISVLSCMLLFLSGLFGTIWYEVVHLLCYGEPHLIGVCVVKLDDVSLFSC